MKIRVALLVALLALCTFSAQAVVLTFEGLQTYEPIANFYNGGLGGLGSGPGPNYGITFTSDSLAIVSGAVGGGGNFSGSPTMPTIAFFLTGQGDLMNVAGGFTTGFSFFYSAVVYSGSITVYDGENGTGSVLATLDLPVTPSGGAPECTYGNYCPWVPIGVAFSGTAKSVNFGGVADYIGFDNITLGSATPEAAVPEPSSFLLMSTGLLAAVTVLRRRRA